MTKITSVYLGQGQTEMTHGPTASKLITDLPPDNGGQGRNFSPTDLLAGALASCTLTIMGKMAERDGADLTGAAIEVEKIMASNPRRVGEFILHVHFPPAFTQEQKERYAGAIRACPVHQTLSKDVKTTVYTD